MTKKIIGLVILALVVSTTLGAQNLMDNEYQRAGREYERQAQSAMNDGRYDEAAEFADLAAVEYRKSREYADMMRLKFRAANAINLAQRTITDVSSLKATADAHAAEIAEAKVLLSEARNLFDAENWTESRAKAEESYALLRDIRRVDTAQNTSSSSLVLPKYYTVVARRKNTDCYWNISARAGVYNNPLLWEKLWHANKGSMKDPNNPHLIFPGMIIEIPSVDGERREGHYDPDKDYSKLR